jgi:hypothetical protein
MKGPIVENVISRKDNEETINNEDVGLDQITEEKARGNLLISSPGTLVQTCHQTQMTQIYSNPLNFFYVPLAYKRSVNTRVLLVQEGRTREVVSSAPLLVFFPVKPGGVVSVPVKATSSELNHVFQRDIITRGGVA